MDGVINSEDKKDIRREQIIFLVTRYYEKLEFLHYESLDVLIEKSLNLFLDSDLTIDEINDKILEAIKDRKKSLEERYDDENVRKNHETIYGKLELLVREFNKLGIDYQLAGALCGYIKYDKESDRCHDDIDFSINEEDISKVGEIFSRLGLTFEDNRLSSPRVLKNGIPSGEHEVIVRDPNSSFHVGIFPFERRKDGSVISKGYYHDEEGNPCVREEDYSPSLAAEIFGREEVDFRGTPIKITPPEQIYLYKKFTNNQKDQHDVAFLQDRIDPEKLMRLRTLSREERETRYTTLSHKPKQNQLELSSMIEEGTKKENDSAPTISKEGSKMLVKKNPEPKQQQQQSGSAGNEDGFISNVIITTLALITFVLCFIGIALIYLIQM